MNGEVLTGFLLVIGLFALAALLDLIRALARMSTRMEDENVTSSKGLDK